MDDKPNYKALLPIGVFLVLYLGLGILFEYVLKISMGFYNIPIVVVFLIALLYGIKIEVKSSNYKTHSSLDAFCKKYSSRIEEKYLVYTKEYRKDFDIFCIPFYFVPFL